MLASRNFNGDSSKNTVRLLLDYGADIFKETTRGSTVLRLLEQEDASVYSEVTDMIRTEIILREELKNMIKR